MLEASGVPGHIIRAIKLLYQKNIHILVTGRVAHWDIVIDILSGVRQGCPLSAALFTLSLSPFIKALQVATMHHACQP